MTAETSRERREADEGGTKVVQNEFLVAGR